MGCTALLLACWEGHAEVVSVLVNAQASFTIPDKVCAYLQFLTLLKEGVVL